MFAPAPTSTPSRRLHVLALGHLHRARGIWAKGYALNQMSNEVGIRQSMCLIDVPLIFLCYRPAERKEPQNDSCHI